MLLIESQISSVHFADNIFSREKYLQYVPIDETKATIITIKESRDFLESIGIHGEIVCTPSHSEDSISVVLDNGNCFVGDLEPIDYLEAYENNVKLKND